jgi:7-carboxy-7-deazaguanine synthase
MFGTNMVAEPRPLSQGFLVKEIFLTIQGEGPWAGRPALFVRFAGCNLRCTFCDTNFAGGKEYTLQQLTHAILDTGCKRVVLTGGEPMLQNVLALVRSIGHELVWQVETAGTVCPPLDGKWPSNVTLVVSPKTPKIHPDIARHADAYKYIIRVGGQSLDDGLPCISTQPGVDHKVKLARPLFRFTPIYVQPCDEGKGAEALTERNTQEAVRIAMRYNYIISLQIHKILRLP